MKKRLAVYAIASIGFGLIAGSCWHPAKAEMTIRPLTIYGSAPKFVSAPHAKIGIIQMPGHLKPMFTSTAKSTALRPELIAAVAYQESRFKAGVCSSVGACGVMQLMPGTARDLKVADRKDAHASIKGGAKYLAELSKKYDGNIGLTLASYNWGTGNVDKWVKRGASADRMPKETRDYVIQITGQDVDVWTGKTKNITQLLSKLNPSDHIVKMMTIFK